MKILNIIGRGLSPLAHLTLEGIRALQSSDRIYGIEPDKLAWQSIMQEFKLSEIINISSLYTCGAKDQDNYISFISFIKQALELDNSIALLIAGNARLGVSFVQMLMQNPLPDVKLNIIDGISSFAVMCNDLAIDPLEQGTSLMDANRMLLFKYNLEPATNYFIYHICSVGTNQVHFNNACIDNQISLLEQHLLKFYSPEKNIILCQASNGSEYPGLYQTITLKQLSIKLSELTFSTTLFIPADLPKKYCNEFYNLIKGSSYDS